MVDPCYQYGHEWDSGKCCRCGHVWDERDDFLTQGDGDE